MTTTTIRQTNWHTDEHRLTAIRYAVFVDEQQVPAELEIDSDDFTAWHWLAFVDNKPVGTIRLTPKGKIGRLAVLQAYRGSGTGRALLDAAVELAAQKAFPEVCLAAQVYAIPFYEKAGFSAEGPEFDDAGIPHRLMRRALPLPAPTGADTSPKTENGPEEQLDSSRFRVERLADTVLDLSGRCRRQLRILSHSLEPEIYASQALGDVISKLARLHRESEVRLLVQDDSPLREIRHPLVELSRRLTAVQLRVIPKEHTLEHNENFVVSDNSGLMVYKGGSDESAWASFNLKPLARDYSDRFDRLWHHCRPSPWFRTLY